MATRQIEVCDVCGRAAKDLRDYEVRFSEVGAEVCGGRQGKLCTPCWTRAMKFAARGFTPTPSGAKRLGGEEVADA